MVRARFDVRAWQLAGLGLMCTGACTGATQSSPEPAVRSAAPAEIRTEPTAPAVTPTPTVAAPAVEPAGIGAEPDAARSIAAAAAGPDLAPAPASAASVGLRAPGFMFVTRGAVVLESEADAAWGTGPTRRKRVDEYAVEGHRDVDASKLPASLQGLSGVAVTMYGANGRVCDARLGALSLYGYASGEEVPADPGAGEDTLPSMPHLVAGFTATGGDCQAALWARRADLPPPAVFVAQRRVEPALVARARAASETKAALSRMEALYAEFTASMSAQGDRAVAWPKFVTKHLRTRAWTQQGGGRTLVMVELGDPENIRCDAYFTESAALMFEVVGDGLRLLGGEVPWRPVAVFDADVDGTLEVLVVPSNGLGESLYSGFELADEVRFPSEDDACSDDEDAEP